MRFAQTHGRLKSSAARAARSLLPVLLPVLLLTLSPAPSAAQPPAGPPAPAARPTAASPPNYSSPSHDAPRTATLADYRGRVRGAAALLEGLASVYELAKKVERPDNFSPEGVNADVIVELPDTEGAAFEKVRGLLPQRERVEWGGCFI